MSAQPVTADDYFEKGIRYYSNPGIDFAGRKFDWLMGTDFSSRKVDVTYGEAMIMGGIMGGVSGGCIGGAVGGPVGIGVGVGIGIPAGVLAGYLYVKGLKIRFSLHEYEEYVKTQEGKEFADKLRELYKNDESLMHLNCAISFEPVIDGVYVKGNEKYIYERKNIEETIDRTGKDPFSRKSISRDDLVSAGEHINYESSLACVNFLKKKKSELAHAQPLMAKGFDIIISDYRNNFSKMYKESSDNLYQDFKDTKISYDEFAQISQKLQNKYLCL